MNLSDTGAGSSCHDYNDGKDGKGVEGEFSQNFRTRKFIGVRTISGAPRDGPGVMGRPVTTGRWDSFPEPGRKDRGVDDPPPESLVVGKEPKPPADQRSHRGGVPPSSTPSSPSPTYSHPQLPPNRLRDLFVSDWVPTRVVESHYSSGCVQFHPPHIPSSSPLTPVLQTLVTLPLGGVRSRSVGFFRPRLQCQSSGLYHFRSTRGPGTETNLGLIMRSVRIEYDIPCHWVSSRKSLGHWVSLVTRPETTHG